MHLMETHGLTCKLGHEPLFEALDFGISAGEAVRLVGRNGSGKSTFLRALIGQQRVDAGTVTIAGRPMGRLSPAEREMCAPLVDQHPLLNGDVSALDNLVDTLSVSPGFFGWFFTARRTVWKKMLDEYGDLIEVFGLTHVIHRPARELSFGQRRLLTLLRALRRHPDGRPRVMLLDEPFAGLQQQRVTTVLDVLRCRLAEGWAIVVAEHVSDIEELQPRCLEFPYRTTRCVNTSSTKPSTLSGSSTPPSNCEITSSATTPTQATIEESASTTRCLLELSNVAAGYYEWEIVSNVNLEVREGQITAIVGPNAVGKSTLFRALFDDEGTKAWIRGTVLWLNQKVRHVRDRSCITPEAVAWIPQERFDFPGLTVEETLAGGLIGPPFRGAKAVWQDVAGHLRKVEHQRRETIVALIGRLCEKRPDGKTIMESRWETLSGGERAIATLAMGLLNSPAVVFLDEPAANLDGPALESLQTILRRYAESHCAGCLVIEHRASFLDGFADRVVRLG